MLLFNQQTGLNTWSVAQDVEAGGSEFHSHPQLPSVLRAILGYMKLSELKQSPSKEQILALF